MASFNEDGKFDCSNVLEKRISKCLEKIKDDNTPCLQSIPFLKEEDKLEKLRIYS